MRDDYGYHEEMTMWRDGASDIRKRSKWRGKRREGHDTFLLIGRWRMMWTRLVQRKRGIYWIKYNVKTKKSDKRFERWKGSNNYNMTHLIEWVPIIAMMKILYRCCPFGFGQRARVDDIMELVVKMENLVMVVLTYSWVWLTCLSFGLSQV